MFESSELVTAPPPWMLVRLALETRQHHAVADEDRLAWGEVGSVAAHREFLERVLGFEAPVEAAIEAAIEAASAGAVEPMVAGRFARAHHARDDLRTLGLGDDEIDALPRFAPDRIRGTAHALGWLFVLERLSVLAGVVLERLAAVATGTGTATAAGTGYLRAQAEAPGARMRRFAEVVCGFAEQQARHPAAIVAAANEAFRCQHAWFAAGRRSTTPRPAEPRAASQGVVHGAERIVVHGAERL